MRYVMLALVAVVLAGSAQAQGPFIVDDDGGSPSVYTRIQDAIDSAPAGVTIYVRPGNYAPFSVDGKGLRIIGVIQDGQRPKVQGVAGFSVVKNVPSSDEIVVRGLLMTLDVRIENCGGAVHFEDLLLSSGLDVTNSGKVEVVRSQVSGGVTATGSALHLWDSGVSGAGGGTGVRLDSSFLFVSGSQVTGGMGAPGTSYFGMCTDGGPGAAGMELIASTCQRLDTSIVGGPGGEPGYTSQNPKCNYGPTGPAIVGTGLATIGGVAHSFASLEPTREGDKLVLDFSGLAGEHVYLLMGSMLDPFFYAPWSGSVAVPLTSIPLWIGILPASGTLHREEDISVPGGLLAYDVPAQGLFIHPSTNGPDYVGSPSMLNLIEASVPLVDCNANDVHDQEDLARGTSLDCDANGTPDECDLAAGTQLDCNGNGIPDACDIASGTSLDLNGNGVPDECNRVWLVPGDAPDIKTAVLAAANGDELVLGDQSFEGVQNNNIAFAGKDLVIRSANGPEHCIISGSALRGVFRVSSVSSRTVFRGLTFRNARRNHGAALQVTDGDPTIDGCVFEACRATDHIGGGAISVHGTSSVTVERSLFLDCSAVARSGGAIYSAGDLVVRSSHFASCAAAEQGGAVFSYSGGTLTIHGSTFRGNSAREGGALHLGTTSFQVADSVFWGNMASLQGSQLALEGFSTGFVSHSDVQGGLPGVVVPSSSGLTWGSGNIDLDPRFVSLQERDYHLRASSPCREAGDPTFVPTPDERDLDGQRRVFGRYVDMGADEIWFYANR